MSLTFHSRKKTLNPPFGGLRKNDCARVGAAGAGIMNQDSFKNLQSIYQSLDLSQLTPGLVGEAIQGMGPLALISGYGANKLVRGGEKLNRAIRAARARSRSTFRVKPVDLLTF